MKLKKRHRQSEPIISIFGGFQNDSLIIEGTKKGSLFSCRYSGIICSPFSTSAFRRSQPSFFWAGKTLKGRRSLRDLEWREAAVGFKSNTFCRCNVSKIRTHVRANTQTYTHTHTYTQQNQKYTQTTTSKHCVFIFGCPIALNFVFVFLVYSRAHTCFNN